jgi:hypothetical protein
MEPVFSCTYDHLSDLRQSLPVYSKYIDLYPKRFKSKTTIDDLNYLKVYKDEGTSEHFRQLKFEEYQQKMENRFDNNNNEIVMQYYDLHETHFQDWAIKTLNDLKVDLFVEKNDNFSLRYLKRARNYAVSTRTDLSWDGEYITKDSKKKEKKKSEIEFYLKNTVLYDWFSLTEEEKKTSIPNSTCTNNSINISVVNEDTLTATENVYLRVNDGNKRIAWLNFANAHNYGGGIDSLLNLSLYLYT